MPLLKLSHETSTTEKHIKIKKESFFMSGLLCFKYKNCLYEHCLHVGKYSQSPFHIQHRCNYQRKFVGAMFHLAGGSMFLHIFYHTQESIGTIIRRIVLRYEETNECLVFKYNPLNTQVNRQQSQADNIGKLLHHLWYLTKTVSQFIFKTAHFCFVLRVVQLTI